jgi:YVTN family beta-propeller protein
VVTADGRRAFITNHYERSVTCLDIDTRKATKVEVGQQPSRIVMHPDERTVYVANHESGSVSIVDTGRCEVRRTISNAVAGSKRVAGLGLNGSGSRLLVTGYEETALAIYDISEGFPSLENWIRTRGLVWAFAPGPPRRAVLADHDRDGRAGSGRP